MQTWRRAYHTSWFYTQPIGARYKPVPYYSTESSRYRITVELAYVNIPNTEKYEKHFIKGKSTLVWGAFS
jgi:hypothetical protein